jgi:hypothetical protein
MPVGAAIVGGVATLGGAVIGSNAAKSAAKTQANAASQAAAQQLAMFNTIRGDLSPYRDFGGGALPGLSALLGYGGTSGGTAGTAAVAPTQDWAAYLSSNPDVQARAQAGVANGEIGPNGQWKTPEEWAAYHYENTGKGEGRTVPMTAGTAATAGTPGSTSSIQAMLESLPGYQFTKQQGLQAVTNRLGAQGLGGMSGAYGKGIARFVTGLADTTFGEQVARLQTAATMGQNAANQTGTFGQNATTSANNANLYGAQATATGRTTAAGQLGGAVQQIGGMYGGDIASGIGRLFQGSGGSTGGVPVGGWSGG